MGGGGGGGGPFKASLDEEKKKERWGREHSKSRAQKREKGKVSAFPTLGKMDWRGRRRRRRALHQNGKLLERAHFEANAFLTSSINNIPTRYSGIVVVLHFD